MSNIPQHRHSTSLRHAASFQNSADPYHPTRQTPRRPSAAIFPSTGGAALIPSDLCIKPHGGVLLHLLRFTHLFRKMRLPLSSFHPRLRRSTTRHPAIPSMSGHWTHTASTHTLHPSLSCLSRFQQQMHDSSSAGDAETSFILSSGSTVHIHRSRLRWAGGRAGSYAGSARVELGPEDTDSCMQFLRRALYLLELDVSAPADELVARALCMHRWGLRDVYRLLCAELAGREGWWRAGVQLTTRGDVGEWFVARVWAGVGAAGVVGRELWEEAARQRRVADVARQLGYAPPEPREEGLTVVMNGLGDEAEDWEVEMWLRLMRVGELQLAVGILEEGRWDALVSARMMRLLGKAVARGRPRGNDRRTLRVRKAHTRKMGDAAEQQRAEAEVST